MANTTTSRGYQLPDGPNKLKDDVNRIRAAITLIDADVTALLDAVSARAMATHAHALADITGLEDALASKAPLNHTHGLNDLSDVSVEVVANGQVLIRQGVQWIPATLQTSNISGLQAAIDAKFDLAALAASAPKASIVDADRILIINSAGGAVAATLWSVIKTTLSSLYAAAAHVHAAATTAAAGFMSAADKTKLDGIAAGAGVVPGVATTTANGLMASTDKVKLNGIAAGASANSTDATLLNRANHTGTQAVGTITGLGTLATKNDAVLTTDVIGILPQANGGTGASAFPGVLKWTSAVPPVGFTAVCKILTSTVVAAGSNVAGTQIGLVVGSPLPGTWRNDSGAAISASAGEFVFTRVA